MLRTEAEIGERESLFHPSLYDVEAVLHLRFFVLQKVKFSYLGLDSSRLNEQGNES